MIDEAVVEQRIRDALHVLSDSTVVLAPPALEEDAGVVDFTAERARRRGSRATLFAVAAALVAVVGGAALLLRKPGDQVTVADGKYKAAPGALFEIDGPSEVGGFTVTSSGNPASARNCLKWNPTPESAVCTAFMGDTDQRFFKRGNGANGDVVALRLGGTTFDVVSELSKTLAENDGEAVTIGGNPGRYFPPLHVNTEERTTDMGAMLVWQPAPGQTAALLSYTNAEGQETVTKDDLSAIANSVMLKSVQDVATMRFIVEPPTPPDGFVTPNSVKTYIAVGVDDDGTGCFSAVTPASLIFGSDPTCAAPALHDGPLAMSTDSELRGFVDEGLSVRLVGPDDSIEAPLVAVPGLRQRVFVHELSLSDVTSVEARAADGTVVATIKVPENDPKYTTQTLFVED